MEAVIFFTLFISVALLFLFVSNKKNKKTQAEILNYFQKTINVKMIRESCSVNYSGLNNRSLNFKYCDLYVGHDSFIMVDNDFGQKGKPKLITKKTNKYRQLFKTAKICKLNKANFTGQELNIDFNYHNLLGSTVSLIVKVKNTADREKINDLIKENNW